MDKIEKLTEILKKLNSGENPAQVREEAREFLASIDAKDLSFAEQKLLEAGLSFEDLKHLCSIHLEIVKDEVEKLKKSLNPGHVIHTLICEHEMILEFLDKLEETNHSIQNMEKYIPGKEEFRRLAYFAEHLIHAEPHHQREEDVLFPKLEENGLYGPPSIMRLEHEDLRRRKKEIMELAENAGKMDFNDFKKKLDAAVKFIVPTLRDHIFKENNILYPAAVRLISDEKTWEQMKKDCDNIGYCCFTPKN